MFKWIINFWQQWRVKISLSIIEQGIFSGGNFVLSILLARWLLPAEYGIFVIAFTVFLFLSGFYQALILEPMVVIGAAHHRDNLDKYMKAVVYTHWGLSLLFAMFILLIAGILHLTQNTFVHLFLYLAVATPLILFFWLFRQACYLQMKPQIALSGSLLYIFFLFLGLIILRRQNFLTPFSALAAMSLASLGTSLLLWSKLDISMPGFTWPLIQTETKGIFMENWQYGKWVFGSAFANWLSILIYLPAVGFWVGLSQAGSFKAMQNVMLPLQQTVVVITLLFTSWLSRERQTKGREYLRKNIYRLIKTGSFLSIIYIIVVVLFGPSVIKLLYGPDRYADFLWLLPFLGLIAFMQATIRTLGVGLKVLQRPSAIFWAQSAGAAFTLSISLYLIAKLGLYGAVLGLLSTTVLIAVMLVYFLFKYLKQDI